MNSEDMMPSEINQMKKNKCLLYKIVKLKEIESRMALARYCVGKTERKFVVYMHGVSDL